MKNLSALLLGLVLTVNAYATENLSESDTKWKSVVEEMIAAGSDDPMKLTVPLKVEVGWAKNWQEVK